MIRYWKELFLQDSKTFEINNNLKMRMNKRCRLTDGLEEVLPNGILSREEMLKKMNSNSDSD